MVTMKTGKVELGQGTVTATGSPSPTSSTSR